MSARCQHGAPWWRDDCPECKADRSGLPVPERNLITWRVRGEPPFRFFYDGPLEDLHWSTFLRPSEMLALMRGLAERE